MLFFEDLNLDGTFNELADVVLGSTTVTDSLPVNGTVTVTAPLSGPVKFTENVVWGFVDSSDSVVEVSEANNLARRGSVVAPRPGEFEPQIEWIKSEFSVRPESNQVWMTPAVIDLNGDEIPDIVFSSGPNYTQDATLRAVSGADGSELWSIIDPANELEPGAGLAVGDIDLDGFPEVIAVHETGALVAFEHDGVFKWKSPVVDGLRYHGSPSIAQMDGSGTPEIVVGAAVIDASGNIRWRGSSAGAEGYGANTGYSSLSVVADLDLDGLPEIVAGKSALHHDGALYWNSSITDGFPGIGNFDADDNPEIVVVASGKVYLLEHTGDVKWGPITIPGGGSGGPPTIADVDGDNQPEIGVAGAERYVVLETDGSVKWTSVTVDNSSNMTGSSVFDFEGDGSAEIVYADEWYLRIFRGVDGQVLYELPKSSGTLWEYPLVVDVDADGNAEIVAVANDVLWGSEHGIYVIGDANDNWVPTRQIWNQHTYHITNVNDDGTIPIHEQNSWETHNTYRLNLQGEIGDPIPAPDLTASYIQVRPTGNGAELISRFGNGGSLFVAPGIDNAFYDGDPEKGGQLLGTLSTTRRLEPGQYEDLSISLSQLPVNEIWVVADDDGSGKGSVSESDELNNIHHVQVEFVTPAVKIVSPKNGSEQSLGQNTLITGHVVAATDIGSAFARTLNRIVLVTVDGRPVNALDSSGNFFASVSLLPGANSYEFMATDAFGQTASTTLTLYGTQASPGEQEFSLVSDVTASFFAEYGRTSFHEDTDILYADVAIRNAGQYLADTPLLVGITNISKPSVRVREPDGVTPEGIPYFDYTDLVADGTLQPGESTGQRVLSFFNPERVQFTYDLVFFGQLNQAPAITTVPNIEALVGRPYHYDVDATDPDEDPVSFRLLAGPNGSTIDPTTGQITLSPISDHLGNHAVVVRVEDARGGSSEQHYVLSVIEPPPNRPPYFTSVPVVDAQVNVPYTYNADAIDPDDDPVSFSLVEGPSDMGIDPTSGTITWAPTAADAHTQDPAVGSNSSLPVMPGFVTTIYADVTDPMDLSFAPTGELYVGRDNSGSGGTYIDAVRIHAIAPRGVRVEEFGLSAVVDPDTVLFDVSGTVSGMPGSVLVGGVDSVNGGSIWAIFPDQTTHLVAGPSFTLGNVTSMAFDNQGRVLFVNENTGTVVQLEGNSPRALFTFSAPGQLLYLRIDKQDRILLASKDGQIRAFDRQGRLLETLATGLGGFAPFALGPGGAWGTTLYAVNPVTGELLRYNEQGQATVVGSGFKDCGFIEFGPDGNLYLSDFNHDRILRIAPNRQTLGLGPGEHPVTIAATDGRGGSATQSYVVQVAPIRTITRR